MENFLNLYQEKQVLGKELQKCSNNPRDSAVMERDVEAWKSLNKRKLSL